MGSASRRRVWRRGDRMAGGATSVPIQPSVDVGAKILPGAVTRRRSRNLQDGARRRGVLEQLDEHVHQEIAIADRRPHPLGGAPGHFHPKRLTAGFREEIEEEAVGLGRITALDRRQHPRLVAVVVAVHQDACREGNRPRRPHVFPRPVHFQDRPRPQHVPRSGNRSHMRCARLVTERLLDDVGQRERFVWYPKGPDAFVGLELACARLQSLQHATAQQSIAMAVVAGTSDGHSGSIVPPLRAKLAACTFELQAFARQS